MWSKFRPQNYLNGRNFANVVNLGVPFSDVTYGGKLCWNKCDMLEVVQVASQRNVRRIEGLCFKHFGVELRGPVNF